MAQRRANNAAMNGYNGRRRAYFLADKPEPEAEPNDVFDNGAAGYVPLTDLGM